MTENTTFFLGANTPSGFHSLFHELYDPADGWRAYILKGGPGTGKSTLMKTVAEKCGEAGVGYETIRCASDPDSLDALRIESKKICIADGTAPHILEPRYPGAVERTVDLSAFWNFDRLRESRSAIVRLSDENAACHKRAVRFLQAAESLSRDMRRLALECVDTDKIERYASRFAARRFGAPRGSVGREITRFFTAVTPQGVTVLRDTSDALCDELLVMDDPYGAASAVLLGCLRRYALGSGLDVIACLCPLHPDAGPQHLFIPQLRLGIVTENAFQRFEGTSVIHASRFTDSSALRRHRSRITFSRRTEKELLEEAASAMHDALETHNELEALYRPAVDFEAVSRLTEQIAGEILT
ncbi:MAG: hypothetical protein IJT44_05585 [Clostridia bacterium]|nr:hypothetical protein [Clostridia bacterium]